MNVKEAATLAREYLSDINEDSQMVHFAVEEVEFDERRDKWKLTVGFFRPWAQPRRLGPIANPTTEPGVRTYKSIEIDDKGERVISVKNRAMS